jgi:ABC-type branched-subunit amino acid transport system ATPase component/branched-subunit amino acid ABC-type transport system permease component
MSVFIQFALLGLGTSAAYSLLAQGLVLIHRGSGVVNFAQGALAMLGALLFYQFHQQWHWAFAPAAIAAIAITTVVGIGIYQVIMRPLGVSSPFLRAVATLGVLLVLEGVAAVIWGVLPISVNSSLPQNPIKIGAAIVSLDRFILFGIALVLTIALWAAFKYTNLGRAVRANSENRRAASALGWSPHQLGMLTWGAGAALAALAGILIAPLISITVDQLPLLVIPVLAIVLIGSFESFWWTFAGAILVGVGQSELSNYVSLTGAPEALPFLIIVIALVIRGERSVTRSQIAQRLPKLGNGIVRWPVVLPLVAVVLVVVAFVPSPSFIAALTITFAVSMIVLSTVVLVGYTGQLSLGQFAIGGIAALVASRLVASAGLPFAAALVVGVIAAVLSGLVFALPALRARGINLAIVTLGLSSVVTEMVLSNSSLTSLFGTVSVGSIGLFGWDIDPVLHADRYASVTFLLFVLCCLLVARLRRGKVGRRLIAVRTNERAAPALGINVVAAKIYSFTIAAAIAGLGGIMLGFTSSSVTFDVYDPLQSILAVAYGSIGGAGYIPGALAGGQLASGGVGAWILNEIFPGANPEWLTIVSGVSLIAFTVLQPNGIVEGLFDQARWVQRKLGLAPQRRATPQPSPAAAPPPAPATAAADGAALEVRGLTVRFGGVVAVSDVSLRVPPGQVVGLIGPNGAGKTTLIDAVTGFVPAAAGQILLRGVPVGDQAAYRRARSGIARSFQSLELFESSTVLENLSVAADQGALRDYVTDLLRPRPPSLGALAAVGVQECELEPDLDRLVASLPYGRRRLVAIARALAAEPRILLLDEPAAGLSNAESRELARLVRRLATVWQIGVLIVEHDMTFVMSACDRVTVLEYGRQIADGTPQEIQRDPVVIAAYLGATSETPAASGSGSRGSAALGPLLSAEG